MPNATYCNIILLIPQPPQPAAPAAPPPGPALPPPAKGGEN